MSKTIEATFCLWIFLITDSLSCTVSIWDFKSARKWVTFRSVFHLFFSGWLPACYNPPTHLCQPLLPFGENYSPHICAWNIAQYDTVSNSFQHIHSIRLFFLSHFQLLSFCPPHSQGNTAAVKLQLRFICDFDRLYEWIQSEIHFIVSDCKDKHVLWRSACILYIVFIAFSHYTHEYIYFHVMDFIGWPQNKLKALFCLFKRFVRTLLEHSNWKLILNLAFVFFYFH